MKRYKPLPSRMHTAPTASSHYTSVPPTKSASNLKELLRLIDWPEPPSPVIHYDLSTSPGHCDYHLLNARDTYRIGEMLKVLITARDHHGRPKEYGGDYFRAKLHSPALKAGVTGHVKDHGNGSYLATFLLPWPGRAEVQIRLIHSSEAVAVLKKKRESHPEKVYFYGYFQFNGISETVECNLEVAGKDVCTYRDPVSGDTWQCVRPRKLPCDSWVYHSMGGYRRVTDKLEDSLLSGPVTDTVISGKVSPINVISDNISVGFGCNPVSQDFQQRPNPKSAIRISVSPVNQASTSQNSSDVPSSDYFDGDLAQYWALVDWYLTMMETDPSLGITPWKLSVINIFGSCSHQSSRNPSIPVEDPHAIAFGREDQPALAFECEDPPALAFGHEDISALVFGHEDLSSALASGLCHCLKCRPAGYQCFEYRLVDHLSKCFNAILLQQHTGSDDRIACWQSLPVLLVTPPPAAAVRLTDCGWLAAQPTCRHAPMSHCTASLSSFPAALRCPPVRALCLSSPCVTCPAIADTPQEPRTLSRCWSRWEPPALLPCRRWSATGRPCGVCLALVPAATRAPPDVHVWCTLHLSLLPAEPLYLPQQTELTFNLSACRPGQESTQPSGFYYGDNWRSLTCLGRHFPQPSNALACLKGKEIHMFGDSTLRQWFEYLERFIPSLKRIDLHVNYQSGPLLAVDATAGFAMRWRAHGLPLRTTKTMVSDLHYEKAHLAGISGGPHTVIVMTLCAHFTTYPVRVYLERLDRVRKAIASLLFRSPQTTVIIKSANTGYKSIYGSDWLSLHLDILLKATFKGMAVTFLDVWDMTSCHYLPDDIHPGPPVIRNEVDLMLSYICPQ
ncbi:NXPE family member 3-like [Pseudophryne corroboree]|uniref:NXPE family member 3-like n=1 Tax=Pseudophryne corroboree TaxID=495146 RepID=UPI003081D71E